MVRPVTDIEQKEGCSLYWSQTGKRACWRHHAWECPSLEAAGLRIPHPFLDDQEAEDG